MMIVRALATLVIAATATARAAESEHYRIEHHGATAVTGGIASGGAYQNNGITGEPGGISQGGAYTAKAGFAGQLYRAISLGILAPSTEVAENSTLQLGARLLMDDATLLHLDASSVQWAGAGPIASISQDGLLTSGAAYAHHLAIVSARHAGIEGVLQLIVRNVNNDDFGLYAADGIDDSWQVQYFGENNPDGAADRDPFGSGNSNLFKYEAGLDPLNSMSRFTLEPEFDPVLRRMKLTMGPCFANRDYEVVASMDLLHWQPVVLHREVADTPKRILMDSEASQPAKYYRVNITIRNQIAKPLGPFPEK